MLRLESGIMTEEIPEQINNTMFDKPKLDLNEIAKSIEKLFHEGYKDDEIAKELGITFQRVAMLRSILGLQYKQSIDVFTESKKLIHNQYDDTFEIKFKLRPEIIKKLEMNDTRDYEFFASIVSKKTIQITFLEKSD